MREQKGLRLRDRRVVHRVVRREMSRAGIRPWSLRGLRKRRDPELSPRACLHRSAREYSTYLTARRDLASKRSARLMRTIWPEAQPAHARPGSWRDRVAASPRGLLLCTALAGLLVPLLTSVFLVSMGEGPSLDTGEILWLTAAPTVLPAFAAVLAVAVLRFNRTAPVQTAELKRTRATWEAAVRTHVARRLRDRGPGPGYGMPGTRGAYGTYRPPSPPTARARPSGSPPMRHVQRRGAGPGRTRPSEGDTTTAPGQQGSVSSARPGAGLPQSPDGVPMSRGAGAARHVRARMSNRRGSSQDGLGLPPPHWHPGIGRPSASDFPGLPADPVPFTGREADTRTLLRMAEGTADGRPPVIVLYGPAGVGKSALAVHTARRLARERGLPVCYVRSDDTDPEKPLPTATILLRLLRQLGGSRQALYSALAEPAGRRLAALHRIYRDRLAEHPAVVVLDNAREPQHLWSVLPDPASTSAVVLVTARRGLGGHGLGIRRFRVDPLGEAAGRRLAAELAATGPGGLAAGGGGRLGMSPAAGATRPGTSARAEPPWPVQLLGGLMSATGGLPLELRMVAGLLRVGSDLPSVPLPPDEQRSQQLLEIFHERLPEQSRTLLRAIALATDGDISPTGADALLTAGRDRAAARRVLRLLADRGFLWEIRPGWYRMPGMVRAYLADGHPAGPELQRTWCAALLAEYSHRAEEAVRIVDAAALSAVDDFGLFMSPADAARWLDDEADFIVGLLRNAVRIGVGDRNRLLRAQLGHSLGRRDDYRLAELLGEADLTAPPLRDVLRTEAAAEPGLLMAAAAMAAIGSTEAADVIAGATTASAPAADARCHVRLTLLDDAPHTGTPVRIDLRLEAEPGHPWAEPGTMPPLLQIVAVPLTRAEIEPATAWYPRGAAESTGFTFTTRLPGTHRLRFTLHHHDTGTTLQQVETELYIAGAEPAGVASAPPSEPAGRP